MIVVVGDGRVWSKVIIVLGIIIFVVFFFYEVIRIMFVNIWGWVIFWLYYVVFGYFYFWRWGSDLRGCFFGRFFLVVRFFLEVLGVFVGRRVECGVMWDLGVEKDFGLVDNYLGVYLFLEIRGYRNVF